MQGWPAGKLRAAAAALYQREPPQAAGNAFISAVAAVSNLDVEVWPENWPAFLLFSRLSTQWSVSMSGRTGLRYESIYPLLDREYSGEAWDEAFSDIQEMEISALNAMREEP